MQIKTLDHVALHVADLQTSETFYRDVLRLEQMPRPDFDFPGAWFRLGAAQELHLIAGRDENVQSHSRGTHFAVEVTDIDVWESHLQKVGANIRQKNFRPDGATQIFIEDPDGHFVELCDKAGM